MLIEKYDLAVCIRTSQLAGCHPFDSLVPEEFWVFWRVFWAFLQNGPKDPADSS